MLFGGFSGAACIRCRSLTLTPSAAFPVILERDALKWFKPAKGQFQIYYKLGTEQPEYIPDFVAETDSTIYMVETKAQSTTSILKRFRPRGPIRQHVGASTHRPHAVEVGTKLRGFQHEPYLLLPHDEVVIGVEAAHPTICGLKFAQ
jgi:type III restriction enzyme